ncbi:MAG: decaprenyl-phosphate phosphoribosyltransferase [Candidatus Aureabacteria bacterium]|nr:decaprenyl-phosphate phosphoribosyltransferase [Candidatus Auribacterota bacterium]
MLKNILPFIRLSRPHQWIKNGFVLAGFIFAGHYQLPLLIMSLSATFLFCLASSSVYAFNDYLDWEKDKTNPDKKNRPVAAGHLSPSHALIFSILLAVITLGLSCLVGRTLFYILGGYMLLNYIYSLKLKHLVILDVFCIALGFMLRMLAGTVAIHIPPSSWIILCTLMISLFLGFAKRYASLRKEEFKHRDVLFSYDKEYLQLLLGISAACTILTYSLYTISEKTIEAHRTQNLLFTVPIVMFGLFRYLYLVLSKGKGDDPGKLIFSDTQLALTLILYAGWIVFMK